MFLLIRNGSGKDTEFCRAHPAYFTSNSLILASSTENQLLMLTITRTDTDHPEFRKLIVLLDRDLAIRDGNDHAFFAQYNKLDKIRHAVLAFYDGVPAGTGAVREYEAGTMEVKRMFVLPGLRGRGIARAVLAELEKWSAELGYEKCILETGQKQPEAIRLYRKAGYQIIPNFGQYAEVESSVCMEKLLEK